MHRCHFTHRSKATFLWPRCAAHSKTEEQAEIQNKENLTAGTGGGKMCLPLEMVWRTSLRPTFQRATWADSLHWGFFSNVTWEGFETVRRQVLHLCWNRDGKSWNNCCWNTLIFFIFSRLSRVDHVEKQTHFWILVSSWKASDSSLQPSFLSKASTIKL